MRRVVVTAALLVALAVAGSAGAGADVRVLLADLGINAASGTPPSFSLGGLYGGRLSLADLKGRRALLYFWASW